VRITKDVIADLIPLYVADEASADTRILVDEFCAAHPEMREILDVSRSGMLPPSPSLTADDQLRTLRRVRLFVAAQRWVFGLASFFTAMVLTTELSFENGHLVGARLLFSQSPLALGGLLLLAATLWIVYFRSKHRLR